MTKKEKEEILFDFFELKAKEFGLDHWSFCIADTPRDSWAHCIPELHQIYLEHESVDTLSISALKDIILHEMAHAIAGVDAKHGKKFREVCKEIGCKGTRAYNDYEFYDEIGKFPWELRK